MLRFQLVSFLLLACTQTLTEHYDYFSRNYFYGHQVIRITREINITQGLLRGTVVRPKHNNKLSLVDVFLGIPYAAAPLGSLRFSPPSAPDRWNGVNYFNEFGNVCPQILPELRDAVKPRRFEELERHFSFLKNQSEDCLNLNIYAPHQDESRRGLRKHPVIVFIHGESYEWNSGNPYDGSILAAYGSVVFVTINFRLGILGFLRPGLKDSTTSNFGLLDQIAALWWIRENIAKFGGDPHSVTLIGHGTGAIFANLLLISDVSYKRDLFNRAILMSGSALSSDAIGRAPLQITTQVAHALNCPVTERDEDLASCLRRKDVESLLNVKIDKPKYVPAFAPLIDKVLIKEEPLNEMKNPLLFGRYDLMYGVTQSEKFHLLSPVDITHGLLDNHRDEILRSHARATHELEPDLVLSKVLEHYGNLSNGYSNEHDRKNRDMVLEALSDSGTVAPLLMTANLHADANRKSYMYVFSHAKAILDYSGQQKEVTIHGEDLAYVLGEPLNRHDSHIIYNIGEMLFSEAIMNWWCNFAYNGNPNVDKRYTYLTDGAKEWKQYDLVWTEYDNTFQRYLELSIPPRIGSYYRPSEMQFWNTDLPNILRHTNEEMLATTQRTKSPRPKFLDYADKYEYPNGSVKTPNIFRHHLPPEQSTMQTNREDNDPPFRMFDNKAIHQGTIFQTTQQESSDTLKSLSVTAMVVGFGAVFLLINITAFVYFYCKRSKSKAKEVPFQRRVSQKTMESDKKCKIHGSQLDHHHHHHHGEMGYKCISKPDLTEVVKNDKAYDNNSNFGRSSKVSGHHSTSTLEAHIKVKEWIQQEIVHRCSPRFLRKTREALQKEYREKLTKQHQEEVVEEELKRLKGAKKEAIYDESPALIIRPGKKHQVPKVSVAVDATDSGGMISQNPVEYLAEGEAAEKDFAKMPAAQTSQIVVIEHHHSKSDPLPVESFYRSVKPVSDNGSTSSLYAKINPKMKSQRLQEDYSAYKEKLYDSVKPRLKTFDNDQDGYVNVTSQEPEIKLESDISPEEALRTIKRRNYPKVLPDLEKRRSLPAPSGLFVPKYAKDWKNEQRLEGLPPVPPPRIFGPSKSLDFVEENDAVTTNLHIGPLIRKPESQKSANEDVRGMQSPDVFPSSGSIDSVYSNPKSTVCPSNKDGKFLQDFDIRTTGSLDTGISERKCFEGDNASNVFVDCRLNPVVGDCRLGNPNWYKPIGKEEGLRSPFTSEPQIVTPKLEIERRDFNQSDNSLFAVQPKIVITPRPVDPIDVVPNPVLPCASKESVESEGRTVQTRELKTTGTTSSQLKQPKIIIKPKTSQSSQRKDRNIPKVSAMPAIPAMDRYNAEKATRNKENENLEHKSQKPPLREKPKVSRIPSFSRKQEGPMKPAMTGGYDSGEIVEIIHPIPSSNFSRVSDRREEGDEGSDVTDSSNSFGTRKNLQTGTIKRTPMKE